MDTLTLNPHLLPARPTPADNPTFSNEESAGSMSRRLVLTLVTLSALACFIAAVALVIASRSRSVSSARRYETETVIKGPVTGLLSLPGRVIPTSEVRVGPEHPGRVVYVAVRAGDRVKKGDLLARLDARQLRADVLGAEAGALAAEVAAKHAQLRLARVVYLLRRNLGQRAQDDGDSVPTAALETAALDAEANLANAAAELHKQAAARVATRASLAAAALRSPIDGVVASRAVEPEETVQAGTPLFVVAADASRVLLVAPVGEVDAGYLHPGPASFEVPAHRGRVFPAIGGAIEPAPASSGAPYRLRFLADNPAQLLQPGMTATVKVKSASGPQAVLVPVAALAFSPDGTASEPGAGVYVLAQGSHPRRIPVEVGVSDGHLAEIRGGALRAGAEVVVGER
jgi:HlyD family secretion protein